jgi:hypothetical protein
MQQGARLAACISASQPISSHRATWWSGKVALIVVLGVFALSLFAGRASAFDHTWSCSSAASAIQCYDYTGQQYVNWASLAGYASQYSATLCSKSITAAGNVRAEGNYCSSGTLDITCYSSGTPDSWAYVYWAGTGSNRALEGHAHQTYCD